MKIYSAKIVWNVGSPTFIMNDSGWDSMSQFENWMNQYVGSSGRWEIIANTEEV